MKNSSELSGIPEADFCICTNELCNDANHLSKPNHNLYIISPHNYRAKIIFQGKVKVDSIDDNEELEFTDAAFDTLGFSVGTISIETLLEFEFI